MSSQLTRLFASLNRAQPIAILAMPQCPFCVRATQLLQQRGIAFKYIDATTDPDGIAAFREVESRFNHDTYPAILCGPQRFIGGFSDLSALDQRGELQAAVQAAPE